MPALVEAKVAEHGAAALADTTYDRRRVENSSPRHGGFRAEGRSTAANSPRAGPHRSRCWSNYPHVVVEAEEPSTAGHSRRITAGNQLDN